MKIALGPLLYYWPRDTVLRYYETIAETAVDLVYLGETVCSRRHELRLSDWLELAARLRAAGKDVVLSTRTTWARCASSLATCPLSPGPT